MRQCQGDCGVRYGGLFFFGCLQCKTHGFSFLPLQKKMKMRLLATLIALSLPYVHAFFPGAHALCNTFFNGQDICGTVAIFDPLHEDFAWKDVVFWPLPTSSSPPPPSPSPPPPVP